MVSWITVNTTFFVPEFNQAHNRNTSKLRITGLRWGEIIVDNAWYAQAVCVFDLSTHHFTKLKKAYRVYLVFFLWLGLKSRHSVTKAIPFLPLPTVKPALRVAFPVYGIKNQMTNAKNWCSVIFFVSSSNTKWYLRLFFISLELGWGNMHKYNSKTHISYFLP